MRRALPCLLALAPVLAAQEGLEAFPAPRLGRTVQVAVHRPDAQAVARWRAAHPGPLRLVLFLHGAFDDPEDLLEHGLMAEIARQERAGDLAPSLWVAVEGFRAWYADRKDGTFPMERFLLEDLLPEMERRHPSFGGRPEARTVTGLSMGGFGALNLAARSGLFGRCAAVSPALVEAPFDHVPWLLRRTLRRAFPLEPEAFTPWNPLRHLGGTVEVALACGLQDKYGLAEPTRALAERRLRAGLPPARVSLTPGGHDWTYWRRAFLELAPWITGTPAEARAPALPQ